MKKLLAGAAALAMLLGLVTMAVAQAGSKGARDHGSTSIPCGDDGTISWSPTALWPPNHKMRTIPVTYTDPDGGQVTLTVTATNHDEVVGSGAEASEMNGAGNTPFATDSVGGAGSENDGSVTVPAQARAERSGRGDGRTYEFEYTADNNMGQDGCESSATTAGDGIVVTVPHDCRNNGCGQRG